MKPLVALALAAAVLAGAAGRAAGKATTGSVTGTVTLRAGGAAVEDRSGVVVYLEGVPGAAEAAAARARTEHGAIRQHDLGFTPPVTVATVGETVTFPNDDKVFHNVFSLSKGNRFDLGLYKSGTAKSVTFKRAGVVDIYCNIHPQMVAKLLVLDTGFFARTDRAGAFRIDGVPPGTYPVVAWQANGPEYRGEVTVSAGKAAALSIDLAEGRKPRRHLRKDGTPYGRYK